MNIVTDVTEWQSMRAEFPKKTIGFVPTMGSLHVGHLSLCQRAAQENEIVVVSIFVNPTQFNQAEDYTFYPRDPDMDIALLKKQDVNYVFMPNAKSMYADDFDVQVTDASPLSQILEGKARPGHFNGVLTVICKLTNLVHPTKIYVGEKDYQQFLLIRKMINALFYQIEVISCETQRDENGLALSSRNARLDTQQRTRAALLNKLLRTNDSPEKIKKELVKNGFEVDYVVKKWDRLLAAVWVDGVRLIDNVKLTVK